MATAHEHFVKAEWHLDQASGISAENPTFTHLVQLAQVHATLAHAAALGANEEPLPGLDDYCFCPLTPPVEAFTHAADCPHSKKSPTVASAEDS